MAPLPIAPRGPSQRPPQTPLRSAATGTQTATGTATLRTGRPAAPETRAVILPGFLAGAAEYEEFTAILARRGCFSSVSVLPIQSWQWYPTLFGGSFRFYLDALEAELTDGEPVTLLGHSAGGWLARLYLGVSREGRVYDGKTYAAPRAAVRTLVTLGSPHYSTEEYPLGRVSERRRGEDAALPAAARASSLQLTNHLYDGPETVGCRLVSVCGTSVRGEKGSNVGFSYKCNGCPEDSAGDGVIPLRIGMANGGEAVEVDCTHGAKTPDWYGSEAGVPQWIDYACPPPQSAAAVE